MTSEAQERLDAWYDSKAICAAAIGPHGDPLDHQPVKEQYVSKRISRVFLSIGLGFHIACSSNWPPWRTDYSVEEPGLMSTWWKHAGFRATE